MPAYTLIYSNKHQEKLIKETVFMKNLGGAKRSALANAPSITHTIEIFDLMGTCLARKYLLSPWENDPVEPITPSQETQPA